MSQSLAADVPASFTAKAVILATGTSARILGIPGERELTGQGVAYCATCDAAFFQDQHVVVVLHEQGVLDCNRQSAEKALAHPKMEFLWNSTVVRVEGSDHVTGVTIRDSRTDSVYAYPCNGVFFFCRHDSGDRLFAGQSSAEPAGMHCDK